jgi:hypothetical protein
MIKVSSLHGWEMEVRRLSEDVERVLSAFFLMCLKSKERSRKLFSSGVKPHATSTLLFHGK